MQVIPAINATTLKEAQNLARQAVEFLPSTEKWIQFDIVDGKFAPNSTFGSPEYLKQLPKLNFEVHLMVENPELVVENWLKAGVKRIIVHVEAISDPAFILKKCEEYKAEAMLAINPDTEVEKLSDYLDKFKAFQILAVSPGLAGQKFQPEVINKIRFLRKSAPNVKIEVDGGIDLKTAKLVKEAGADIITSASYIFDAKNPKKAYEELQGI